MQLESSLPSSFTTSTRAPARVGVTPVRVGALDSPDKVSREAARVYRAMRRRAGRNPNPQEAETLRGLLDLIARLQLGRAA